MYYKHIYTYVYAYIYKICQPQAWGLKAPLKSSMWRTPSVCRLVKSGIGKGMIRTDHPDVSHQLFAKSGRMRAP